MAKGQKLTEDDLRIIIESKITVSVGSGTIADPITSDRLKAMQYYKGEPFGDERAGFSQVISRDVAEAVDSMLPSLLKIFASGDTVCQFNPTKPQAEAQAAQRTDYANWVWHEQNDGYRTFHTWFKDALLQKLGTVKIWYDESVHYERETYDGLSDLEYQVMCQDEDLELLEHTSRPDPDAPPPMAALGSGAPAGGLPGGAPPPSLGQVPVAMPQAAAGAAGPGFPPALPAPRPKLHDAVFRRRHDDSQIRIAPVPPDETMIERQSGEDELPWGNRRRVRVSRLLEEFPDKRKDIEALPWEDSHDLDIERIERYRDEGTLTRDNASTTDINDRMVWVIDAYLRVDYDGDGYSEMRKITTAGLSAGTAGAILDNVEIDDNPFCCLTPIPMPHKLIGMSIADQSLDIQRIKSTLIRQGLDNVYRQNGSEIAVTGKWDIDALLNRRPGNVIRGEPNATIEQLQVPEMLGDIMRSIQYFDSVRDQRTGAARFTSGPGADALNNAYTDTATGANLVESASQERIAFYARTFAETGVKRAFRRIDELASKHIKRAQMVKLRGQWIEINPADWNERMDCSVTVGLGTNNKAVQAQQIMGLLVQVVQPIVQLQQGLNGPLVTAASVNAMLTKLAEAMGFKPPDRFFPDPAANPQPPAQHPPDPATIKANADLQKTQLQAQAALAKTHATIQSQERQAQLKAAVERELGYAKIAVDNKAIDADAELKARQHATDTAFKAHEAQRGLAQDNHAVAASERDFNVGQAKDERDFRAANPAPPKPRKLAGIKLVHDAAGMVSAAHRHFDDGTVEQIPIAREAAQAPTQ